MLGKVRAAGKLATKDLAIACLQAWSATAQGRSQPRRPHPIYGLRSAGQCRNIALIHLAAADILDEAKAKEKSDLAQALEKKNRKLENALNGDDITAMYDATRSVVTEYTVKVHTRIRNEDDSIACGALEVKQRWRRHFASLMSGEENLWSC